MVALIRWAGLSLLAFVALAVLDGLLIAVVTTVAGWGDAPRTLSSVVGWTSIYSSLLFWIGLLPAMLFLVVRHVFMSAERRSWGHEAVRGIAICLPAAFVIAFVGYSQAVDPLQGALIETIVAFPIWPAYGVAVAAIRRG